MLSERKDFVIVGEFVINDRKYPGALKVWMSITDFYTAHWDLHWQWLLDGFNSSTRCFTGSFLGIPLVDTLVARDLSLCCMTIFFFFFILGYITE